MNRCCSAPLPTSALAEGWPGCHQWLTDFPVSRWFRIIGAERLSSHAAAGALLERHAKSRLAVAADHFNRDYKKGFQFLQVRARYCSSQPRCCGAALCYQSIEDIQDPACIWKPDLWVAGETQEVLDVVLVKSMRAPACQALSTVPTAAVKT